MSDAIDSHTRALARQTIGMAPWCFGGALLVGAATLIYGVAPVYFLLLQIGIGLALFLLLILAWRWRSEGLRMGVTMFALISSLMVRDHAVHAGHLEPFACTQGFAIIFAIWTGLMWALRWWIQKFARLAEPVA